MPEDLLDARAGGKQPSKHVSFDGDDEDFEGASTPDSAQERSSLSVKRPSLTDEDDDADVEDNDQDMASDLARSVSAVESVYQEMDSHSGNADAVVEATVITHDFLEPVEVNEDLAEQATDVEVAPLVENETENRAESNDFEQSQVHAQVQAQDQSHDSQHSSAFEATSAPEYPEVPIAAEVDPVTGIYRLKTKAEQEEADREELRQQNHGHNDNGDESDRQSDSEQTQAQNQNDASGDFSQLRIPITSSGYASDNVSTDERTEYGDDQQ
jgi:hypothetical protein